MKTRFVRYFLQYLSCSICIVGAVETLQPTTAEARARGGSGRSFGRTSPYRRSAPPQQRHQDPAGANPNAVPPPPSQAPSGGLFRGIAGGLAGGFLGSMLFNSLGHASGIGAGGRGGLGLLEIMLIGGIAFFAFRYFKNRRALAASPYQSQPVAFGAAPETGATNFKFARYDGLNTGSTSTGSVGSTAAPSPIDKDEASDIFFKVQAAWARRDVTSAKHLMSEEMAEILNTELADLKRMQRTNKLENISVRNVDVGEVSYEGGADHVTVRFTANLLDYTVDDVTGNVVSGSTTDPVRFEEDWTFKKVSSPTPWQLVGIQYV